MENLDSVQLLNTAIIKSKEKEIDQTYEERLKTVCSTPVFGALNKAIASLSESQKISRDEAAIKIVETIRELDTIWNDYVMMEGIDRLKTLLKKQ
ncbi:MAG: hypothetical protein HOE90_16685 [Bacteriovoracaceae bacterium]|jgi:hypothetical protein|nr:hypothetical protein [Bacteriovoracaceae bacterium]